MIDRRHPWNTSLTPLLWGFVGSLVLIFIAYLCARSSFLSRPILIGLILGLGALQSLVQVVCFLHVGIEHKPYWSLIMFLFMMLVTFLIIGGSLWIMTNLDYNVMPTM